MIAVNKGEVLLRWWAAGGQWLNSVLLLPISTPLPVQGHVGLWGHHPWSHQHRVCAVTASQSLYPYKVVEEYLAKHH